VTSRGGIRAAAIAAVLLLLFFTCAFVGGAIDPAIAAQATAIRAASPFILHSSLIVTNLGSAPVTLALGGLGALVLLGRRDNSRAAILLVAVIAERLAVEGLKLLFGRPRPILDPHFVQIHSLSFPSGHAANSLTAWVLFACFLAPARFRRAAIAAAFFIAFVVGVTRVLLGVHWLSDVIGGWAAGLLAVMLALAADRRLGAPKQ
jgi:membrane-associated phospholipid phosphatase